VTILVGFDFATIDIQPVDDEWSSGEEIPVIIVDGDQNKNSRADEDLDLDNPNVSLIPALKTGDPFTLGEGTSTPSIILFNSSYSANFGNGDKYLGGGAGDVGDVVLFNTPAAAASATVGNTTATTSVDAFSQRLIISDYDATGSSNNGGASAVLGILIELDQTIGDLRNSLLDATASSGVAFNYINWDVRSTDVLPNKLHITLVNSTGQIIESNIGTPTTGLKYCDKGCTGIMLVENGTSTGFNLLSQGANGVQTSDGGDFNHAIFAAEAEEDDNLGIYINFTRAVDLTADSGKEAIVIDFFSFGFTDDGVQSAERVANQIVRIEAEETGDNTSTFEGSLEYIMVNQINIQSNSTFNGLTTIADDPSFIVIEDLTDEDAPRVNYNDLGADGVVTPVSDQEEAPSHSGVVSLNQDSYKIADTVVITLDAAPVPLNEVKLCGLTSSANKNPVVVCAIG
jgi:hypothetical protein